MVSVQCIPALFILSQGLAEIVSCARFPGAGTSAVEVEDEMACRATGLAADKDGMFGEGATEVPVHRVVIEPFEKESG